MQPYGYIDTAIPDELELTFIVDVPFSANDLRDIAELMDREKERLLNKNPTGHKTSS